MLNRLEEAINFAVWAHRGQVDKVGRPFIFHPLYVMMQMNSESERIVAVLHDVLEDCPEILIPNILDRVNLTKEEVYALVALTHIKNEPYKDYINRILKSNKIAINVKWEDVRHNSSLARMKDLPDDVRERMEKKYRIAVEMLFMGR